MWVSPSPGVAWSSIGMNKPADLISDRFPAFKLFREWPCRAKVRLRALSLQICASDAPSCETGGKWPRNSASQPVYAPSDVRAATSVELRASKCATKMDDSNTALCQSISLVSAEVRSGSERLSGIC
ncbi:hypothetical protein CHARACLAT_028841 [Characodon lateralis]|uniref:Uncharacterized protein n=1 Tax=Characodon lateralis TaxID=208331 RepID=A0ABU7DWS7_9TELE|nr:hypothetical protein [Characodon lateralis]